MKNILDFAEIRRGQETKPDMFEATVKITSDETGEEYPHGFGITKEHIIRAEIFTTFWANDAEYRIARERAMKNILHIFYADIIGELNKIRSAVYAGDKYEALGLCDKMEKDLMRIGNANT